MGTLRRTLQEKGDTAPGAERSAACKKNLEGERFFASALRGKPPQTLSCWKGEAGRRKNWKQQAADEAKSLA